jgi:hypothetical protein
MEIHATYIFLLIIITVVGGLYYLSTKNKAKPMPVNPPEHLTATSRKSAWRATCREKMGATEIEHKHPGKWRDERVSCLLCHTRPKGVGVGRQIGSGSAWRRKKQDPDEEEFQPVR